MADAAPAQAERASSTVFGSMADWLGRLADALERRAGEVGATDGETVYDARRRNFDKAIEEAKERDRRRAVRGAS